MYFRSNLVEDPGWVEKRELRIGMLVTDADDPKAAEPKRTMAIWRTAADAAQDCSSLTTFVREP